MIGAVEEDKEEVVLEKVVATIPRTPLGVPSSFPAGTEATKKAGDGHTREEEAAEEEGGGGGGTAEWGNGMAVGLESVDAVMGAMESFPYG